MAGKLRKLSPADIIEAIRLYEDGLSIQHVADKLGVKHGTIFYHLSRGTKLRPFSRSGEKSHFYRHGFYKTPGRNTWLAMISRCYNKKNDHYFNYGGRGILVCNKWRKSFSAFAMDMGPPPSPNHSIERIDNNKGYSPENCKWATRLEQSRNRRGVMMLTHNGETLIVTDWAKRVGLKYHCLRARIIAGWPVDLALTTPTRVWPRKRRVRRSKNLSASINQGEKNDLEAK